MSPEEELLAKQHTEWVKDDRTKKRAQEIEAGLRELTIEAAIEDARDRILKLELEIRARDQQQARLEQRIEELEKVAETDPLTGLPNRRRFESDLGKALKILIGQEEHVHGRETDRVPDNYDLMIGDLDGFKWVNDNLGHKYGDDTLKAAARILTRLLRPGDLIARWGGDEFAFLLKNSKNSEVPRDRIATNLPKLLAPMFDGKERVGISLGVVRVTSDMTKEQIIEEADQKMYEIKAARKAARGLPFSGER